MSYLIEAVLNSEAKNDLRQFIGELRSQEQKYLLRNDILNVFERFCQQKNHNEEYTATSYLSKLIYYTQEIILEKESICAIVRPNIAFRQEAYQIFDDLSVETISTPQLFRYSRSLCQPIPSRRGETFRNRFSTFL